MADKQEFYDISVPSVRRAMVLLALGAITGLAIAGYGLFTAKGTRSRGVPAEAVAVVNQRQILRSDFMTQLQTQFTVPFAETTTSQRQRVLQDMINEEVLMQRGLEIDLPSYDPDVRAALVAGVELEVTADVLARQPTPEELRDYYEKHKDKYAARSVMQFRDLVVRTDNAHPETASQSSALSARAALIKGEKVEAVMKAYGLADSGRFLSGGKVDLGDIFQFAVRAKSDDAFYKAAIALKDGETSPPISQPDGVHLIVMIRHRFAAAPTYEAAANQVWSDARKEAQDQVNAANISYLRSRADIVIAHEYVE